MSLFTIAPRRHLATSFRRRHHQMAMASVDVAADLNGRRSSGDPRLDFVQVDSPVRL